MDINRDLFETLVELSGDRRVEQDDVLIVTNDCPAYGGTSSANTPEGLEEGISFTTYCLLNPLEEE
jgi:hypothetical protein